MRIKKKSNQTNKVEQNVMKLLLTNKDYKGLILHNPDEMLMRENVWKSQLNKKHLKAKVWLIH